MLHILYGDDDFSIQENLTRLKTDLAPPDLLDANLTRLQASASSLPQVTASCSTVPFLSPRRMVILEGLLSLFDSQRAPRRRRTSQPTGPSSSWLPVVEFIPTMLPSTDLVLLDGKIKKDNMLLTRLSPLGRAREFSALKGPQLGKWISDRARQKECTISPAGVRLLTDLVGSNLWALSSEIEKLSLYCQGRIVQREDVHLLVPFAREMTVFNIVDAILDGNYAEALSAANHLLERGTSATYIVTMIARQVRLLILAKSLEARGVSPRDMGKPLGLSSDWLLNKVREQARRRSASSLESLHRGLLETDRAFKTGRIQESEIGEFLVEVFAEASSKQQKAPSAAARAYNPTRRT